MISENFNSINLYIKNKINHGFLKQINLNYY